MALAKKRKESVPFDDEDMKRRAVAAWLRGGAVEQPSWSGSTIEESAGNYYVVLRNVNGVMAVYRIRNDGVLKRLKRWPEEVNQTWHA